MPSMTCAKFETDTQQTARFRSARMRQVLARFRSLDLDSTSKIKETLLRKAVETWIVTDPKEYASRNATSHGLCAQLATELGVKLAWEGSNREVISAHLLTCRSPGAGAVRAVARSKWLKCSLEDRMLQIHADGDAGSTAVIVIDMQAKPGATLQDGKTAYNSASVIDNQVSVLEAAVAYGMHVVEVRIVTELFSKSDGEQETRVLHDDPTLNELGDVMDQAAHGKYLSIKKPFYNSFQGTQLDEELVGRGIKLAIVMGFDANLCVRNTIFGTPASTKFTAQGKQAVPYLGGLLDRGIDVLTSRVVLASSGGAHLEADYGMTA